MSILLKEKLLDRESLFAKNNPKLFDGLTKFVTLVEDEQQKVKAGFEELKEQAKNASVKSVLQLRRTQATPFATANPHNIHKKFSTLSAGSQTVEDAANRHHSSLSDMFQLEDSSFSSTPLKEDVLIKQGKDRIWRERYFVLKPEGVLYYESLSHFKMDPKKPKGKLLFCDLICPSGQAADEVPKFVYLLLGRSYVFCLHSEDNTFVVSAPTKEGLRAWVAAVNGAFNNFILMQSKKSALMDAVWVVGSPEIWQVVNKLTSNSASMDQVLGELFLILLDQFEGEMNEVNRKYETKRAFYLWREMSQRRRQERQQRNIS